MLKRLDKLMARAFAGPFVVTFGIAIFVLMMQVLWLYLDDIAGKGLGFFTVIELMSYKCVGLVPLALPLALLISSVMVLGGMAEHYELSSFKSSGTSLLRVMRVLIVAGVVSSAISFATADYVIPAANLQFGSRMYDIQQKKPTFNMEPGVFNEDFDGYAIRLGGRAENGRDIDDVLIYDHSRAATGELGQITAEDGEMYITPDGNAFVMNLRNGTQYSEQRPGGNNQGSRPYVRTSFASYTKVFDLSEFEMGRTNPELFNTNRSMLATWQLAIAVDSINKNIAIRKQNISNHLLNYLPVLKEDTIVYREDRKRKEREEDMNDPEVVARLSGRPMPTRDTTASDSSREAIVAREGGSKFLQEVRRGVTRPAPVPTPAPASAPGSTRSNRDQLPELFTEDERQRRAMARALDNELVLATQDWQGIDTIFAGMSASTQDRITSRIQSGVRAITGQARAGQRILPGIQESRVKHIYDLHMKYSMALVCIIFIFIGAPMGAIVRKGGFGIPILVSIIFFVIFIILTIFCRKLAESFVVDAAFAGWLPCIILFPISLYITSRAMRDAKLVNLDGVKHLFTNLVGRLRGA